MVKARFLFDGLLANICLFDCTCLFIYSFSSFLAKPFVGASVGYFSLLFLLAGRALTVSPFACACSKCFLSSAPLHAV